MTYCWDIKDGKVVGMVGIEEIKRRIHDPNYMPEYKALQEKLCAERAARKREEFKSKTPDEIESIRQEWIRHIKKA